MEEFIMLEEKVQEAEVEEVKAEEAKAEEVKEEKPAEQPAQQQGGMSLNDKNALIAFILACVGLVVCGGWFIGNVAGVVLGIIALSFGKKGVAENNPFKVFQKIAKPVAIAVIILSAILFVVYLIIAIVQGVAIAAAAIAAESAA